MKKPTVEDVRKYCIERGNRIDPEAFVDYYEANGWKVGRAAMQNWQAAVRTWERNQGFRKVDEAKKEAQVERQRKFVRRDSEELDRPDSAFIREHINRAFRRPQTEFDEGF